MGRCSTDGSYLPNSLRKKLASDAERLARVLMEAEEATPPTPTPISDPPRAIEVRKGGTSHNCAQKDAGKCHPLTMRCIHQHHMGCCRVCNHLVSAKDGCNEHHTKGDELQYSNLRMTLPTVKEVEDVEVEYDGDDEKDEVVKEKRPKALRGVKGIKRRLKEERRKGRKKSAGAEEMRG